MQFRQYNWTSLSFCSFFSSICHLQSPQSIIFTSSWAAPFLSMSFCISPSLPSSVLTMMPKPKPTKCLQNSREGALVWSSYFPRRPHSIQSCLQGHDWAQESSFRSLPHGALYPWSWVEQFLTQKACHRGCHRSCWRSRHRPRCPTPPSRS